MCHAIDLPCKEFVKVVRVNFYRQVVLLPWMHHRRVAVLKLFLFSNLEQYQRHIRVDMEVIHVTQ